MSSYQAIVEQAKSYIVKEFLPGYPGASFAELEDKLKSKGFFKQVPTMPHPTNPNLKTSGYCDIMLGKQHNAIIWITPNEVLADAFQELAKEQKIKTYPTAWTTYMMDGHVPDIPIAKSVEEVKENPQTTYWVPVILNTPERQKMLEMHLRENLENNKKFKAAVVNPNLVASHICMTGLGYYLVCKEEDPEFEELDMLFYDLFGPPESADHHSAKCRMPDPKEVELAKEFIKIGCSFTEDFTKDHTSYGLKHIVEKWTEEKFNTTSYRYVSNGAFITAALELGYKMQPCEPTGPNAYFNMKLDWRPEDENFLID